MVLNLTLASPFNLAILDREDIRHKRAKSVSRIGILHRHSVIDIIDPKLFVFDTEPLAKTVFPPHSTARLRP